MTATAARTATVEVLTAEVRVLMVGSRQVTLSVCRQLDEVGPNGIEPFGRIRDSRQAEEPGVHVIGRDFDDGSLVRSKCSPALLHVNVHDLVEVSDHCVVDVYALNVGGRRVVLHWNRHVLKRDRQRFSLVEPDWRWRSDDAQAQGLGRVRFYASKYDVEQARYEEWCELPLIVLAGLR